MAALRLRSRSSQHRSGLRYRRTLPIGSRPLGLPRSAPSPPGTTVTARCSSLSD